MGSRSLPIEIVEAVAEHRGVDPEDLSGGSHDSVESESETRPDDLPQLGRTIDTDALEALRGDARIVFDYADCTVTVWEDGQVSAD